MKHISEVMMEMFCKESPFCAYPPNESGYCFKHEAMNGLKKPKAKDKINPVSEKRKALNQELAKIVKRIKIENPECSIKSPNCTGKTEAANHKQKRSPKNLIDPKNLEACCRACNLFIELNPGWAKENGHQISRFVKV